MKNSLDLDSSLINSTVLNSDTHNICCKFYKTANTEA